MYLMHCIDYYAQCQVNIAFAPRTSPTKVNEHRQPWYFMALEILFMVNSRDRFGFDPCGYERSISKPRNR